MLTLFGWKHQEVLHYIKIVKLFQFGMKMLKLIIHIYQHQEWKKNPQRSVQ